MKPIFLDYNSTTPVIKEVLDEMLPYFTEYYGNASSAHSFGQKAMQGIDKARIRTAKIIGAKPEEIIFTGGGSESNNLALTGLYHKHKDKKNHIITSAIEHSSVFNTCKYLETLGAKVSYIGVDKSGRLNLESLEKEITESTLLISVMLANNETGTIQDIRKIADIAETHKISLHTDAVQAIGKIEVDVNKLGVDMLSIAGHKLYAPKGIGALYIRKGLSLDPIIFGGGQEKKLRSGTENVPSIVGLGKACEIAYDNLESNIKKYKELRDYLESQILDNFNFARVNGSIENRLPNTLNISFGKNSSDMILVKLDLHSIAASAGAACGAKGKAQSRTLTALGISGIEQNSAIRFSVGKYTTKEDILMTIDALKKIMA